MGTWPEGSVARPVITYNSDGGVGISRRHLQEIMEEALKRKKARNGL